MPMKHVMPLLVLVVVVVGVVSGRYAGSIPDDDDAGPIELPEARRICASLCMYGLGGKPCGKLCSEIQPYQFPSQSQLKLSNGSEDATPAVAETPFPRRDACPLLCHYQLGEPLCDCPTNIDRFDSIFYDIDFGKICAFFCINHSYQIYGCDKCQVYREHEVSTYGFDKFLRKKKSIDWDGWCKDRCSVGDGGVACNCDILPLSLPFQKNQLVNQETQTDV